ncbi:B-cell receptor CD22-like [Cololabis saira]|uniref:B-cell receptor CD22-like n=1 Tax=Cololabis saira TaxID=129043 RepID=UPI002AD59A20|nr:B-cell receptor CD22-like [Cololabis saira]
MSLSAAAGGFLVLLLSVSVVQSQAGWGVTYPSTQICAVKGSTVEIHCTYTHPHWSTGTGLIITVEKTFWFTRNTNVPVDLTTERQYSGRVLYKCHEKNCTLRISDLRESDSANYKFRFITNHPGGSYIGEPGVTLSVKDLKIQIKNRYARKELGCYSTCPLPDSSTYVWYKNGLLQVQVTRISVHENQNSVQLKCHSSCSPPGHHSYVWFKNGQKIQRTSHNADNGDSYTGLINPQDRISCAVKQHEQHASPAVYAPDSVSVSVDPSGVIMEGTSVTLACSSDANPAANYTWYKNRNPDQPVGKDPHLIFSSVQPSDFGEYYCEAENQMGRRRSGYTLDVKYAPRLPSVSVSPSGVIMEGTSVTLSCSSDANPVASSTWYKSNRTPLYGPKELYLFTSISLNDSGIYYCQSENKYGRMNSSYVQIDVQYAPKTPFVSVSPPGEIVEGSSMNLTCSSDAKPAANYTWYKENEPSPRVTGETFTIVNIKPQHGGNYYCEARNSWGHQNSTLHLTVLSHSLKSAAAGSITALLMAVIFLSVFIFIRIKWSSKQTSESRERPEMDAEPNESPDYENLSAAVSRKQGEDQDDVHYASVRFHGNQEDPLYSVIIEPKKQKDDKEEEDVVYSHVKLAHHKTDDLDVL